MHNSLHLRTIAVTFAIVASFIAWSQPQSPGEAKGPGNTEQKTTDNQQNSDPLHTNSKPASAAIVEATTPTHNAEAAPKPNPDGHKSFNETLIAWGTVVLAGVTTLLAFYTYRLWTATKQVVEDGQRTSKISLRAYMNIGAIRNHKGHIALVWINNGNTPAFNFITWGGSGVEPVSQADIDDLVNMPGLLPYSTIPPGSQTEAIQTIDANQNGSDARLFVWGICRYTDIFGETCIVSYQNECIERDDGDSEAVGCHIGNTATYGIIGGKA